MMQEKIHETLAGLKDFQAKTVDYVFKQLYTEGRSKMLIADEVGLGKTIVAKGIIAKAFGEFVPTNKKKTFNAIYICSNQALARQNLKKLNFAGDPRAVDYSEEDDRLTGLAYISNVEEQALPFRIKAFTPATSFDDKTHAGRADERVLLYRLLYSYSDLQPYRNSLKWILKGGRRMNDDNWERRIKDAEDFDAGKDIWWLKGIRPKVYSEFRKALEKTVASSSLPKCFKAAGISCPVKYWTLLRNLCGLGIRKNNYFDQAFCKELISSLRFVLSRACVEFLQGDIFILDEFQRYKRLIDGTGSVDDEIEVSPAIQLARDIFSFEDCKILMLSATPFKPYTNEFDELNGEVHYKEFVTVLKFLMADKAEEFWKQYEHDRKAFFSFLRHPEKLENFNEARSLKDQLESLYRTSIVRTEKLLASKDRDALIKFIDKPISIQADDINDFVVLDQITQVLNKDHNASLAVPLEYVKSCPFALSFLDHYQHKEKLKRVALQDEKLQNLLKQTRHGWVNLKSINEYKPLIPAKGKGVPNAKLRLLLDETVHNNGWKYLWIPPSIPYYELTGAFQDSWGYSKTLIFSSWKLVPKMVASLVSYEAERLSIGNPDSISEKEKKEDEKYRPQYFQKRRSPRPQFTFKVLKDEQEPQQMNNFILSYPSLFLCDVYDPAVNITEKKSFKQIKKNTKQKLVQIFNDLNLNRYVNGEGDWQKWYWLAPLLFDKFSAHGSRMEEWLSKGIPPSELSMDSENVEVDRDESSGRGKHFDLARQAYQNPNSINVGKLNAENLEIICEHLAEVAIGSPSVCYLRSEKRHFNFSQELLDAAFNVASAFHTMLNKPESVAIVRLFTPDKDYWERALKYMIDGNIQALLDEFLFLLVTGEGLQSASEISDFISDILSVRTATSEVDDYSSFKESLTNEKSKKKSIRFHYAVDFGTQKINTAKGAGRQINIRQAFNSPFRPFVLASTSIGQEGLDFHLYCRRIFHWNLPANPIDFEQREGRIHRYQGLVIRLNLAFKYRNEITCSTEQNDVWKELFDYAQREKDCASFPCDLVPFWHTETVNDIKIERYVPTYPFSKDVQKFNNLIKILTYYRLTFGQPRQEELIEALHSSGFTDEAIRKLDDLIINLCPMKFLSAAS
jgi:hypothetical protein